MKPPKIIVAQISQLQLLETSLVAIILSVIVGFVTDHSGWFIAAATLAGIGLLVPKILYPVAIFWFSLGNILSTIVSPLLLTVVFLLIITPIGTIRRWLGHDSLQLRQNSKSMFKKRDHMFTTSDLENSF
ncbi:SxtJ family membrane protein [Tunicatimonas pelagia]|uniref:SxtJ family membrane protein n=1 Tax=Tunicatimonas pelagia TaxID=931531 RepID=UPI0026671610|nr:SxtJ family membrane protein [Tunicatimonas pelagia]WKN41445.1 SxtJ family membrane protein [Tunicatimonas pelagia]